MGKCSGMSVEFNGDIAHPDLEAAAIRGKHLGLGIKIF